MNIADRGPGAVIGALVGNALGLGPHWYYDLTKLRKIMATGSPGILTQSLAVTIQE